MQALMDSGNAEAIRSCRKRLAKRRDVAVTSLARRRGRELALFLLDKLAEKFLLARREILRRRHAEPNEQVSQEHGAESGKTASS